MRLSPWSFSPNELDHWFDEFGPSRGFVPAIDMYQDKDNVIAETPITGIDPEKVDISIENDVLTITGKSEHKREVDEKNYYRREVRYGSFHRSISLPTTVNGSKAKAEYGDGILKVIIPKEEKARPKKVKIVAKKK